MRLGSPWISALVLGWILLGTPCVRADSEFQKFEATLPPGAKLGFIPYQACAIATEIEEKGKGASFADIEAAIDSTCNHRLSEADRALAQARMSAAERAKTIERYTALALAERRLGYEGKPIPGYRADPRGARLVQCVRKIRGPQNAYILCVNDALHRLVPFDRDPADVVADSAMGICEPKRSELTRGLSACFDGDQSIAEPYVSNLSRRLRSIALGIVAADRAEPSRRQMPPDQAPAAPRSPSGSQEASGTAFFVSNDGRVLTNDHVVNRCNQIHVAFQGRPGTARVVARDENNDLALLATDLHPVKVPSWRLLVRQGEDIVVYGFPMTGVLASGGNVVIGNVTALAGLGNDGRFLQISAPIQPGNSGGPLLDRNGNVVGIVVAKLNALSVATATGDIPQNVNFAIKASVAAAFLDAQRVARSDGEDATPLSTPDIARWVKALTVQVACTAAPSAPRPAPPKS